MDSRYWGMASGGGGGQGYVRRILCEGVGIHRAPWQVEVSLCCNNNMLYESSFLVSPI